MAQQRKGSLERSSTACFWFLLCCLVAFPCVYLLTGATPCFLAVRTRTGVNKNRMDELGPDPHVAALFDRYFPQHRQCRSTNWRREYADLHHSVVTGRAPPRFLTSVAQNQGMADRITGGCVLVRLPSCCCLRFSRCCIAGVVTQFYLAVLSKRALTMVTYDDLPPFESACIGPYFNFTHPEAISDDAINPAKDAPGWNGEHGHVSLFVLRTHPDFLDILCVFFRTA